MTRKCLNYRHEMEMKKDADSQNSDGENENFWEQIHLAGEVTMEMLQEGAEKMGIDLENSPDVELPEHIELQVEKNARDYGIKVHNWLKKNQNYINQKAGHFVLVNDEESVIKIKDAMEVIQWYSLFISAKVHRACMDLTDRQNETEDVYDLYSDNLGSAKTAVIAIERSIHALSVFYQEFKEKEDELLKMLMELASIKKQLLETFPGVMDFKRPGFDD